MASTTATTGTHGHSDSELGDSAQATTCGTMPASAAASAPPSPPRPATCRASAARCWRRSRSGASSRTASCRAATSASLGGTVADSQSTRIRRPGGVRTGPSTCSREACPATSRSFAKECRSGNDGSHGDGNASQRRSTRAIASRFNETIASAASCCRSIRSWRTTSPMNRPTPRPVTSAGHSPGARVRRTRPTTTLAAAARRSRDVVRERPASRAATCSYCRTRDW